MNARLTHEFDRGVEERQRKGSKGTRGIERRHDGLGKHRMEQKEGDKTQRLIQTHKHRHRERDTEGKDTRGNLIIQELNRENKEIQNKIIKTINEPEHKP